MQFFFNIIVMKITIKRELDYDTFCELTLVKMKQLQQLSFRKAHYSHQKGAIFECTVYFMYLWSRAPVRMSSCGERSRTHEAGVCAGAKLF